MPANQRGRQTRTLCARDRRRLEELRLARRLSLPQLRMAMDAPFTWQTLKRALAGLPVWDLSYRYIVNWLAKHCPEKPIRDGKAAAAGDPPESPEEQEAEDYGSIGAPNRRGSRP